MNYLLGAAWVLIKFLSYGGFAVALAGVAVFGWHFVRINARAAERGGPDIPLEAWRGTGAMRGLYILACGAGMQIASMLLAVIVPGRL